MKRQVRAFIFIQKYNNNDINIVPDDNII